MVMVNLLVVTRSRGVGFPLPTLSPALSMERITGARPPVGKRVEHHAAFANLTEKRKRAWFARSPMSARRT
jgi:hypothetical protein